MCVWVCVCMCEGEGVCARVSACEVNEKCYMIGERRFRDMSIKRMLTRVPVVEIRVIYVM